tara:strand:- start:111 stop:311 length:201 start_codon:yes stop_codon:yes gene_type:complete
VAGSAVRTLSLLLLAGGLLVLLHHFATAPGCVRLLRPRLRALRMAWLRRRLGNAVHVVLDDLDNEG